ncbi:peptidase inhibitor family I36 protein [Streptomyces sp. NPDC057271]|uniref:peptidase inhibitor family I36 protein n=1 Tax=Streptomyces sp. NPDC057271 TaxID=3346078 RepID=UPI003624D299
MRTSLLRRLASAAGALGLASLGLLGTGATPARAAISDCPSGYFCAWQRDDNGTGPMFKTNTSKATLGTWDNKFRTVINRTSMIACLYDDANYGRTGGYQTFDPRQQYATGGYLGDPSSLKFVRTVRECEAPAYPYWNATTAPRLSGFGDMNADRKADVLVRDAAGRLWFLPGDNTGRLVGSGGWNSFNALLRHGDFSRDGREDVIARETSTGRLWLYPGTGSGGLGARKLVGSGGWNGMNALVGVGDMNSDGRADLYAREASTGKLWLYPGRAGSLGGRVLVGSGGWNSMVSLIAVGDSSGDSRPDLLALDRAFLYRYMGTGTGGLRTGERTDLWWGLEGASVF